ncbi:hypothetical protein [Secundilactobacillus mixtipabuli]|uniref:hypothetical protein n=1 Tax=Secundilactobacillus mixtipabuli TaxID=1435342 RepID=UPI001179A54E|nr:hypothetical protein [Secundilactobacillus mixtipabuli]
MLVATGATLFLDATIYFKAILYLIFSILNFILFKDLLQTKHLLHLLTADSRKTVPTWLELLAGLFVVIWSLQVAPDLTLIENLVWIPTNAICGISTLYALYQLIKLIR